MQQLILPLNTCKVTAAYQNKHYRQSYGYSHYGVDYADGREIVASGTGVVYGAGYDQKMGNTVVILYPLCKLHDGSVKDLTLRYCHLEQIEVKQGQVVVAGERIGITGQTPIGKINGIHLHLEVDTDTKAPLYTPSIAAHSNLLRAGYRGERDSTLDPSTALYIGEGQRVYRLPSAEDWTKPEDAKLPVASTADVKDCCRVLVEVVRMISRMI